MDETISKRIFDGIKGVIFDLDGTLFDSLWVWEEIDRRFLNKRGYEVPPDYSRAIAAMGFRKTAEYTIERFHLDETPEILMDEWMDMARAVYENEIALKPFAKELLLRLKAEGKKLGIATSSHSDLYMPALKSNGIADCFDVIADTAGYRGKDFPDIYLAVANKMGFSPSECLVFEDLPVALKIASEAGFKTVAVCDRHFTPQSRYDYALENFGELL